LTLQLTDDPLALGFVLALEGIPRAAIMLLGGAITDRFSPRVIMFTADVTRFVLTSLMAFLPIWPGLREFPFNRFAMSLIET
jgi:hypothetical protein